MITEILAKDDSWGTLYDLEQLSKNEMKVSAVTYVAQYENHHHTKKRLQLFKFYTDILATCTWTLICLKRRRRRSRTRSSMSPISWCTMEYAKILKMS
jgi:hypothetical protein